ncbi:acyl carrier protein [Aldersonia sp. NBC_00410]|uniref:acyl carrier protein n=1 Tax=Aldersonia sp. NBC_00410 TaxID=2975954 RepID=UPI0022599814|nr:acyl carrier protein [Aldersonia sp. NBC_00410]MCX5042653.1 acyl carrier protein [Aldersonia sp. NBC_00410]
MRAPGPPWSQSAHRRETCMSTALVGDLEQILREDLAIDTSRISRESRLIDDVGLDSVGFAVGMVAIEEKLGVVLDEEELLSCNTVGDLADIITAKAGQQLPA